MSRLFERFTIGGLEVFALSDGAPDRALDGFFHGVEPAEWMAALGLTGPQDPVPFNFGSFLVRGDGATTLIDAGFGPPARTMGVPGGGELLDRIAEAGVRPEEIDRVLITHLHADHCGWLTQDDPASESGGATTITFPNARVVVARAEIEFWLGSAAGEIGMATSVRPRVEPVRAAGLVDAFEGEHAVSTAITMVPTPGHTPGHASVMLASQGEHLLITGDAAHHPVHLEHHDWIPSVDLDRAESQRSRAKLAALATQHNALITGGHFAIPTLGRLRQVAAGYRWERA